MKSIRYPLPLRFLTIFLLGITNLVQAAGTCTSVTSELSVSIPCVSYQDVNYEISLVLVDGLTETGEIFWKLEQATNSTNTGICATTDTQVNINLPCVEFNDQTLEVDLSYYSNPSDSTNMYWSLSDVNEHDDSPVLYIVSMMHAEDHIDFHESENVFTSFANKLRSVKNLLREHGGKIDFGPDWPFLKGAINFDPELLPELIAEGHGVHTHAHESSTNEETGELYDLGVVNNLLAEAGAPGNRIANGGFVQSGPDGKNWVGYVESFTNSDQSPMFDTIIGYKDLETQVPESLNFMIQATNTGELWQTHDTEGQLLYTASNMLQIVKGGVLDFSSIRDHMDTVLANVTPGRLNTMYWHDSLHNYTNDNDATGRLADWELFLTEYLDPLIASGRVQWKTFTEMTEIYKSQSSE